MDATTSDSLFALQATNALGAGRGLPSVRQAQTVRQAHKVAEDFEAVFLSQMLQPMFEDIEAAAPFGGSASEKMWQTMQVDEYGKAIAKAGGIGIADSVFREIIRAQELR